jgi:hypothetical protein
MPALRSQYTFSGLTLSHQSVLEGTDLTPEWALVRVRKTLEERRGTTAGRPADGDLAFDARLTRVVVGGALLPYDVVGDVRAELVPGGLAVTASASLANVVLGCALSVVAATVLFRGSLDGTLYRFLLGAVAVVTVLHVWQTAGALKAMTAAGTTL